MTSPEDGTHVVDRATELIGDSHTTELTPGERRSLARSRKVAFCVIAACAVLSCAAAVYFWYLWFLTATSCVDTYILKTADSIIIHPELASSWQSYFIGLDISSFSALTLALLFSRLAYVGSRNTLRYFRRDGWAYFGRAYHSVLFTEGFETLCVRFGLLGTLLSFLLAAVSQLSSASATPYNATGRKVRELAVAVAQESTGTAASPGTGVGTQPETTPSPSATSLEGAKDSTAVAAGEWAANGEDSDSALPATEHASATGELSTQIFLLLCASLVSTFVGTGVAYVVTPSLNWINERALGLHQLGQADTKFAAEEFFRQVTRTSQRLAQFEATTVKLAQAAENISSFDVNVAKTAQKLGELIAGFETRVGTTSKRLTELIHGLERAVQTFDISTQTGKQLAKKLDQLEAMSDGVSVLLDGLPKRLNDPLKNMSLTAGKFREAALSGEAAFRALKDVAGTARESLGETAQRTNTTWQMLAEMNEALKILARNEEAQTSEISKLVHAFDTVGTSLGALVGELVWLGTHLRERDGNDRDEARLVPGHPMRVSKTATGLAGEEDRGIGRPNRVPTGTDPDRTRSWWRRLIR
ncbi:MAG: hypothetical protein ACYC6N_29270 [Pirellulaceae bacterium]